ncbi:MAG TPA: ECF-type sigma factor [Candidatus Solibacter sp.]|nr:ECF-type sigma factor [Candidatus Solibacter sp.]
MPSRERADEMLALDDALTRLTEMDGSRGKIVELRVFAGLRVEESAEVLGVSAITVMRD